MARNVEGYRRNAIFINTLPTGKIFYDAAFTSLRTYTTPRFMAANNFHQDKDKVYGRMGLLSFTTVADHRIRSGGITEMEQIASIFVPTPITISHRQIGNDLQK